MARPKPVRPARRSDALCLRSFDFGDSSQIVVYLVRGQGKLRCIARGAKNSQRRFHGPIEPLTAQSVDIQKRRKADGLYTLNECDVLDSFYELRQRLSSLAAGLYVIEFLQEMLPEDAPQDALLDRALHSLGRLGQRDLDLEAEVLAFELHSLSTLGIAPNLSQCVACGTAIERSADATFDGYQGGVICSACPALGPKVAICAGTRASAAVLAERGASAIRLNGRLRRELRRIVDAQIAEYTSRELKMRRHWGFFAEGRA